MHYELDYGTVSREIHWICKDGTTGRYPGRSPIVTIGVELHFLSMFTLFCIVVVILFTLCYFTAVLIYIVPFYTINLYILFNKVSTHSSNKKVKLII